MQGVAGTAFGSLFAEINGICKGPGKSKEICAVLFAFKIRRQKSGQK
ncbi:hypothetical protein BRYFOR_08179 [Marvinbryantia formatexigens DSM 14469]|uniref:Uncharacterized protein n=1 Tax=Marvinbryantia formatexigens DSM 14469 TaxID=478749 RepID=C6LHR5_9FIRM|nr:hypothetical protein BRYFOR_08179 [Marvinbryantia formatexigens DSM 14469]